jgi:hypothetical protein
MADAVGDDDGGGDNDDEFIKGDWHNNHGVLWSRPLISLFIFRWLQALLLCPLCFPFPLLINATKMPVLLQFQCPNRQPVGEI